MNLQALDFSATWDFDEFEALPRLKVEIYWSRYSNKLTTIEAAYREHWQPPYQT